MNCKNHDDREGVGICITCGSSFCHECLIPDSSRCLVCQEKSDVSNDILSDILNSVEIPQNTIANFNPTDILIQIENEISLQQEFDKLDLDIAKELNHVQEMEKFNFENKDKVEKISIENEEKCEIELEKDSKINIIKEEKVEKSEQKQGEDINQNESNIDLLKSTTESIEAVSSVNEVMMETSSFDKIEDIAGDSALSITESTVVESIEVDSLESNLIDKEEEEESTDSTITKIKQTLFGAKDAVVQTASSIDTTGAKESAKNIAESAKTQANKLSKEAKVKSAGVAAGVVAGAAVTKEKAIDIKNATKSKVNSSKEDMNSILDKIKDENQNGEYDHLLGRFTTTYGEGKKSEPLGNEQYALPLKINAIFYFIASLIPGIAQLYLGLTKRGTTILLIASCFLFITNTPQLFIITAILSFADAYKLRNIYYRGGKIEDNNNDITKLLSNGYVILMIIFTIIINLFN